MNFLRKFLKISTSDEVVLIPSGKLFLTRSPESPKGELECLYNDAFASIRQTAIALSYKLVITRVYQEGELAAEDDEGYESSDQEQGDDFLELDSVGERIGRNCSKDEYGFIISEELKFFYYEKSDGSRAISWKDLLGDPGDSFEFVIDDSSKQTDVDSFMLTLYKCQYEQKYHRSSNDISSPKQLKEFVYNPRSTRSMDLDDLKKEIGTYEGNGNHRLNHSSYSQTSHSVPLLVRSSNTGLLSLQKGGVRTNNLLNFKNLNNLKAFSGNTTTNIASYDDNSGLLLEKLKRESDRFLENDVKLKEMDIVEFERRNNEAERVKKENERVKKEAGSVEIAGRVGNDGERVEKEEEERLKKEEERLKKEQERLKKEDERVQKDLQRVANESRDVNNGDSPVKQEINPPVSIKKEPQDTTSVKKESLEQSQPIHEKNPLQVKLEHDDTQAIPSEIPPEVSSQVSPENPHEISSNAIHQHSGSGLSMANGSSATNKSIHKNNEPKIASQAKAKVTQITSFSSDESDLEDDDIFFDARLAPEKDSVYEQKDVSLFLFELELETFKIAAKSPKVSVDIIDLGHWEYQFAVQAIDLNGKPLRLMIPLLRRLEPTFNFDQNSFIFNQSTERCTFTWLIKFKAPLDLTEFQIAYLTHLWQAINKLKYGVRMGTGGQSSVKSEESEGKGGDKSVDYIEHALSKTKIQSSTMI